MASGSLKVIRARHSYGDIPTYGPPLKITRLPQTEDELWHWYRTVLGVQFPRKQCCAEHIAPFQLVCDVYFRRYPTVLVTGSRGFSGKSYTLAAMAIGEAILHGVPVNVLGGSASQSLNVHEISQQVWWQNYAPRHLLARDPSRFETTLTNGGRIRALLASSRSVRGPHPNVLCLDEADEMEIDIVDAALGQPMPQVSGTTGQRVPAITVIISTHHYPHGTMTELLERARERGHPSYKWCIASGSLITTARGEVPIEEVHRGDVVLTRQGWRPVQHLTFMGFKETVGLRVGSRVLRATPDHLIATPDGWRTANALKTDSMASAGAYPGVLGREEVPFAAVSSSGLMSPGTLLVDRVGHHLHVLGVDTGRIAADVVDGHAGRYGADYFQPDPSVSADGGGPFAITLESLDAVSGTFGSRPVDAISGEHGNSILPVWDIGVEGCHEFIAEGVVVHNCYRETELTPENPTGWLETATIAQKRAEVTPRMWQIEYDLGDPAVKDTLIDPMSVERMWDLEEGYYEGKPGEEIYIEKPRRTIEYAHGVDWAKKRDWTVHTVWRPTDDGWRLVYFCRQNRKPWPEMVTQVMDVLRRYPGTLCHDATGVGDVISDLFPEEARRKRFIRDIVMRGESRSQMFSDYVRAIEGGMFKAPRIKWAYEEHLYLQYESLYSTSGHPPDSVVSGSMAWLGRGTAFNIDIDESMMGLGSSMTNSEWSMAHAGAQPLSWDPWGASSGGWDL